MKKKKSKYRIVSIMDWGEYFVIQERLWWMPFIWVDCNCERFEDFEKAKEFLKGIIEYRKKEKVLYEQ